jgi:hypothetical protein
MKRGRSKVLTTRNVMGQPSYVIASDVVHAAITRVGGQMAPVRFKVGDRVVEPLSVAPWWKETPPRSVPAVARILRGDFFCLPFGLNVKPHHGERYVCHGEPANTAWRCREYTRTRQETVLHLSVDLKVRKGTVDSVTMLRRGQTVVYQTHRVSGLAGPSCYGHHAMVKIPEYPDAAAYSCSKWRFAQVATEPVELPEQKGYSLLKVGAVVDDLERVPTITGELADLTRYPRGRGYEDVVAIASDPGTGMAWNAVTFPRESYVWFVLRDPRVLASTMLWLSNGGRHYPPWSGRHTNVLGIEDNTAFYHWGIADSVNPNPHSQRGIATFHTFDPAVPFDVNYIMGVAEIPEGYTKVADIVPAADGMELIGEKGQRVKVPLDLGFLKTGAGSRMRGR